MRRVVSVSLGSSKRDKQVEAEFLGERFCIERRGTDGDLDRAVALIRELDGKVDAIGLGGIDLYLVAAGRKYAIRDARRMAEAAKQTPVVDGSGLKNTWERKVVRDLVERGQLHPRQAQGMDKVRVLITSGVDRFGMAETFASLGADLIFGDLIFALNIPVPIRRLWQVAILARLVLPIVCRQPHEKIYPLGDKQDKTSPRHHRFYQWADVICGDFHYVRRFMPDAAEGDKPLAGKTVLTNTITEGDVEDMRRRGVARLITTTPEMDGRSFGTNVMEGVIVSLVGKRPEDLAPEDYLGILAQLGWEPRVIEL